MTALIGKYFIGVHDDCMRSGVVEAAVSDGYFLVRFDQMIGFNDGTGWPDALGVVHVADMVGGGGPDEPPAWWFFDNQEQRAKYEAWLDEPALDRKPKVVPIRQPSSMPTLYDRLADVAEGIEYRDPEGSA